jgi:germination protein M
MKKLWIGAILLLLIAVAALFLARSHSEDTVETVEEGDIVLYYISSDGTSFYQVPYTFSKKERTREMAVDVLNQLKQVPKDEECQASIPSSVVWSDLSLEDSNLIIDFTSSYSKLNATKEIFMRASIVKSLVQISGISSVEFKQTGTPLMTLYDEPVGPMTAETFIDDSNTDWGAAQDDTVTLFYANETGDKLVGEETKITVENNVPMEQEIIQCLIDGSDQESCYCPVPEGTEVIKTVTKNGTCYVDLNENFLNPMENVSAEVTVYAIVNSLAELSTINKVQFTINGEKVEKFRETLEFDVPFYRNLDLYDSTSSQTNQSPSESDNEQEK